MNDFIEKLRLKEMAEEDIYFAKRDVELIKALRKRKLAKRAKCKCPDEDEMRTAKAFEDRFEAISEKHENEPRKLLRSYRTLLDEIWRVCKRRK